MPRTVLTTAFLITLSGCTMTTQTSQSPTRHVQASRPAEEAGDAFLRAYAETRRFSAGQPRSIKLAPDGSAVYFLRAPARSVVQDLYVFDTATGRESVLLTADQILAGGEEELTAEELARRERMRMSSRGISTYDISDDGQRILVPLSGKLYVVERESGAVIELPDEGGYPIDPRFSPDGTRVACVREGNLFVIDIATGTQNQLTSGATERVTYGLSEFVAQEEMGRMHGYWWSPDGAHIAVQRTDTSALETMHIADSMNPDRAPQSWPYPRAGRTNAEVTLAIVPADGGDMTWVSWDQQRYPYLATVRWSKNAPLTLLLQNREQTTEVLLGVDEQSGETQTLLIESDEAWLNLDQSMPKWLSDGSAFLWTTERNGSWQLELRARDGVLLRELTDTNFGYQGFVKLDERNECVYIEGAEDPTQSHLFLVSLKDKPLPPQRITTTPGIHNATFSENARVYVHTRQTTDGKRSQIVRYADGRIAGELKSLAEAPPFIPNVEFASVAASPEMHTAVVRPRDFVGGQSYPVIVFVYGGPHSQMVRAAPLNYLLHQWMADHGYIVVSMDGRGTPSRGREWERAIKGDLIDIPLKDQVAGLKALGAKFKEMDLSRVGIFGWSFGGYFSAMAVMREPEVFKAGVAGAPVVDWRDYDTHYTERYMGLPDANAAGYDAANVLTYAPQLDRPLMVIHGTADDNVYLIHSLRLVDALLRAGRPFEFVPLPGFTHGVREPDMTVRVYERIMAFFDEYLR